MPFCNSIYFKSGYKYQLTESYVIILDLFPGILITTRYLRLTIDGILTIQAGYAWDGPSGPALDTKSAMRGSLVHDGLFQLMRLGLLPSSRHIEATEIYRRLCLEDGMSSVRAWLHFTALTVFGWYAAMPGAERPVQTAP